MLVLEATPVAACASAIGVLLGTIFGTSGATALVGPEITGNIGPPTTDLLGVGAAGTLAAVTAAAVAALGAVRTRVIAS